MKIQLTITENKKTIKIEENIKLNDLILALDKMFPNKEWAEFELETNTIIAGWSNPIYIEKYIHTVPDTIYPTPVYPWIVCDEHTEAVIPTKYTYGTFNVEI